MIDEYVAHDNKENGQVQSVSTHNLNVSILAERNCPLKNLAGIAGLAGYFHDAGKYQDNFIAYIEKAMKDPRSVRRGEVDHATAGGQMAEALAPKTIISEMMQLAIYSHHGLYDGFSLEDGEPLMEKRLKKVKETEMVSERFYCFFDREKLVKKCEAAGRSIREIKESIVALTKMDGRDQSYGNKDFFLGMYQRILVSLLIDSDRTDTRCFCQGKDWETQKTGKEMAAVWNPCIAYLEEYLGCFVGDSQLDRYRKKLSLQCREAAKSSVWLYRLMIPTGGGKTLSGLRFALHHAAKHEKQHIIYVAPFNSILEQNAEEIRAGVGNAEIVLEHHSNVIFESENAKEQYDMLTENWDCPIIATTAVQFLNTLFSSQMSSVRRMHQLCNSVIIFDEIQALPVRTIKLFNLAINFLTELGGTTVVLCSATQPPFDRITENKLLPAVNMVESDLADTGIFKRTTITDLTGLTKNGLSIEVLGELVRVQLPTQKQILIIVNTKGCAKDLYQYLQAHCCQETKIFHLSTNMCAAHRQKVLGDLEKALSEEKPLICVSTQLIEAGVNLSFRCVFRSLAGLDNIIQAAGRCNRHAKMENGDVYVVQMSPEAENVSKLRDIQIAQESMRTVLHQYKKQPESLEGSLDGSKSIQLYYEIYLSKRMNEMEYTVSLTGGQATLVELLSSNNRLWKSFHNAEKGKGGKVPWLKQAFKTAGDLFEVISEDGKIDIVAEYDDRAKELLAELQDPYCSVEKRKQNIRKLQRCTVGISEQMRNRLGNALYTVCDGTILALSEIYYSKQTGVSETPVNLEFITF